MLSVYWSPTSNGWKNFIPKSFSGQKWWWTCVRECCRKKITTIWYMLMCTQDMYIHIHAFYSMYVVKSKKWMFVVSCILFFFILFYSKSCFWTQACIIIMHTWTVVVCTSTLQLRLESGKLVIWSSECFWPRVHSLVSVRWFILVVLKNILFCIQWSTVCQHLLFVHIFHCDYNHKEKTCTQACALPAHNVVVCTLGWRGTYVFLSGARSKF